ncbi:MAG TPA: lamin tail domain-containing protein [Candidatus Krumholzibacteria bacterium]|nr:lamin tail domain-containing protein [Candidatus Krumholzibacteria bacterium]
MKYVAFFISCLIVVSALAPQGIAQVRVNEILGDPATDWNGDGAVDSKLDEWVEVVNVGTTPVDLSSYRISDASAGESFRFALAGTLAPGEVRVYFGSDVVAWQAANGVGQFGFSLNNSGDTVALYEVNGADISVADSYAYATAEVADDRSVGRMPNGSDDWVVFDGLNPYSGTVPPAASGCAPSPGAAPSCPTATQASTWGRVKALYRGQSASDLTS